MNNPSEEPVAATAATMNRRRFLTAVTVVSGALAAAIVGIPAAVFSLGNILRRERRVWQKAGAVGDFRAGETVPVRLENAAALPWDGIGARRTAWLRREADGQFTAFAANCTHLGCPVRWDPAAGLFMCPCHGGVYYSNGGVAGGPPPAPCPASPSASPTARSKSKPARYSTHNIAGMKFIINAWQWLEDRTGLGAVTGPMLAHLVPPGSRWWYVLGSATLIAFIIQIVTGIALATVYVPSAGVAYASVQYITTQAPWGRLLRGMHYFGASAMILFAVAHMVRVYLMAAYKFPREINWLSGVALLALTLVMGFTGQILRWDQNAVWSAVVGAEQAARAPLVGNMLARMFLSGGDITSASVGHFFTLHVFIGPGLLVAIIGLHLWLILRHGISEPPVAGEPVDPKTYRQKYQEMLARVGVPFFPEAAWRDALFGAVVVAGVVLCAWWFGPPALDNPPDPSLPEANPRPDWYLLWYFAVLALLPHRAEDYVIILAPLLAGVILFGLPFLSNHGERSWRRRPWAVVAVIFIFTCIAVLWRAGAKEAWTPDFHAQPVPLELAGPAASPARNGCAVFNTKGCLSCHAVSGRGGTRGPALTDAGDRLTREQIVIRILNGGYDMPAYANNLTPAQLESLAAFLESRKER